MTKKRRIKDFLANIVTYIASSTSIVILVMIFGFIFITGNSTLSLEMITSDYWSQNHLVGFEKPYTVGFDNAISLNENQGYSDRYGVLFEDIVDREYKQQIIVKHIEENSIFNKSISLTAGPKMGQIMNVSIGDQIEKINVLDDKEGMISVGRIFSTTSKELAKILDESEEIESLYFTTPGGGIWGSLLSTLKLILISLSIALPLGVFSAIYLNEISRKGKTTNFIQYSIELLAGIPSIIFGLMGVIVLYPITTVFNIEGLSILLGSLTMSVILLPVIIRSVQESLKTVPDDQRMASLSLGANETQTIFRIVLPRARSGILSTILLSISRIIGESAALIYTMGTFINDTPKIKDGATTLSVHIWSIMSQEQPNFELASAISIVILAIVLFLNLSVKYISKKLDRSLSN